MTGKLKTLLAQKGTLLADGATGTNFFNMGLISGDAPELWNEEQPEKVKALHQGFVDAGADIILTNTFGGNRHRLKLHNAQDRSRELNRMAAELAPVKSVIRRTRPFWSPGLWGPTGELFEPLGELTHEGRGAILQGADDWPEGGWRRRAVDRNHVRPGRNSGCSGSSERRWS